MKKNYYQQLAGMGMLLIIFFVFQHYRSKDRADFSKIKFIEKKTSTIHKNFDPNELDENEWGKLGFSSKQASTILNYKKMIGGKFVSKQQLKQCFAISDEKFHELSPFMKLSEDFQNNSLQNYKNYKNSSINISVRFNPDDYTAMDWQKLGFSQKQSESIIKYKKFLGGSFISKEKFRECFIINEENYNKISPFLILPENPPLQSKNAGKEKYNGKKNNVIYQKFDPNTLDIQGWRKIGFSDAQAQVIVNYREKNLKGSFKNLEEIQHCFVISSEKFNELKPYISLNPANISTNIGQRKTEVQQEKTDFSKTNLNSVTFKQLIEFGLDERSAGSIIGFRKKLGGFMNKEQILTTYNINKELVQKLLSIAAPLDTSSVQRYSLADAPEDWLKNHPYFKYSADKIIFFRISNPDDKKIWKLLKLKPEYEERMKLYTK